MTFPNHFNQRGNIPHGRWRRRLHEVIFEADTPAGKAFDLARKAGVEAYAVGCSVTPDGIEVDRAVSILD